MCMRKQFMMAVTMLAAGMMFVGNIVAQQTAQPNPPATPATKTQQSTAAKPATTATKSPTATAAKTTKPAAAKSPSAMALTTQKAKTSYAIGLNIGRSMKTN